MRFLNFIQLDLEIFLACLQNTSDIELLGHIQKLSMELSNYWVNGIPKYKGKLPLSLECIEAKKELLAALLNEYQLRRALVE